MKKSVFALVLLLLFVVPLPAQAEEGNTFTLSPFIGGMVFDGAQDIDSGLLVGLRAGYNFTKYFGLEVFGGYMDAEDEPTKHSLDVYHYGMDLILHLLPDSKFIPFLAVGAGGLTFSGNHQLRNTDIEDDGTNFALDVGGGVKYYLNDRWAVRLDVRDVVRFDDTWNNLQYTLGLSYLFGGEEKQKAPVAEAAPVVNSDCDNVPDNLDTCPNTPCGCEVDANGCPLDADKDGICDGLDKCPNTLVGCDVNKDGCPVDTDQDGACDSRDKCPNTPVGCDVDNNGCPVDADKDGVCDGLDKCPGTAAGCAVDKVGCPFDADKDGVCDGLDKCPGTAAGVWVDTHGCPEFTKMTMILDVKFDFDKTAIKKEFQPDIDKLADFMKTYPDTKTTLEGHTDSVGSAKYNMGLSKRRAESVRKYLVKNYGIAADRLSTVGYGETKPIASNATEEGRYQNRMVQAKIEKVVPKKK